MKKLILTTVSALALLTASAEDGVKFKISGTLPDTVKTVVVIENGNQKAPVAQGEVKNGKFTIEGSAQKNAILGIGYRDQQRMRYVSALNDGEPIEIRLVDDMTVKGSKLNNEFGEVQVNSDLMAKAGHLIKEWQKVRNDNSEAGKAKAAELMEKINAIEEETDSIRIAYIKAHKNDMTPAMLMSQMYYNFDYKELVDFVNSGAVWLNSPMVDRMKKQVEAMGKRQPGVKYTDLEMNDTEGKLAKLSQWVGKGNYVLVDFWASWCGPCRAENPNVKKIYSKYHDQGLEIISISLDAKLDPWKQAIEKDQLPWIHISDLKGWNSVVTDVYEIHAIPQLFILDADNRILAEGLRGEELEKFIAGLFK